MTEQERLTILYGDPALAAPERVPLCAGPLSLQYAHGDLRTVCWGRHEIVRRLYATVRDENWGTIPIRFEETERAIQADSFRIVYEGRYTSEAKGIDFRAVVTLIGGADGTVVFDFDGESLSTFKRNRIGICVLHPTPEVAGRHVVVTHADGTEAPGVFPDAISPHQPFENIASLTYEVAPGVRAHLAFSGDVFEMEDQRNWLDASFKTYSTPLALPMPVEVPDGTRIHQRVTLTVRGAEASDLTAPRKPPGMPIRVSAALDSRAERPFRHPGLLLPPDGDLPESLVGAVGALKPDHLRVDIDANREGWQAVLRRADERAARLGVDLLVGVRNAEGLGKGEGVPSLSRTALYLLHLPAPEAAAQARAALPAGAHVVYGSSGNFTELNRNRPRLSDFDGLYFAGNPQVHAFDSLSIMETPPTVGDALRTAEAFGGLRPRDERIVGPLTLTGAYRSNDDPRHRALFGAAWYLAAFASAADAGATRVTLSAAVGPQGALGAGGEAYPLGSVLRELPGVPAHLAHVNVSDPHVVSGLALWANDGHGWVFVVNRTDAAQRLSVHGFSGRRKTLRVLDETTEGVFYTRDADPDGTEDALLVTLRPYAVAVVATEPGR